MGDGVGARVDGKDQSRCRVCQGERRQVWDGMARVRWVRCRGEELGFLVFGLRLGLGP